MSYRFTIVDDEQDILDTLNRSVYVSTLAMTRYDRRRTEAAGFIDAIDGTA